MKIINDVVEICSKQNFSEEGYIKFNHDINYELRNNPSFDVKKHLVAYGLNEVRSQYNIKKLKYVNEIRKNKIEKLQDYLNFEMENDFLEDNKISFLSERLKKKFHIVETNNVSSNNYDPLFLPIIEEFKDGLILDCGAGLRKSYYPNIVNYEIANYWSTDILGVGEILPFKNNTFDALISVAVLEHVKDPFQCAREIIRVLKPGGKLFSAIPFLQPYHGYPHHYYNMTYQGHSNLYEDSLEDMTVDVIDALKPIFTLTWFLNSYINGLPQQSQNKFLDMKISDLIAPPISYLNQDIVAQLSPETNMELACGTLVRGVKK